VQQNISKDDLIYDPPLKRWHAIVKTIGVVVADIGLKCHALIIWPINSNKSIFALLCLFCEVPKIYKAFKRVHRA